MKQLLTIIFTLASVTVFSQIEFEPGYFIDNSGDSTRCLIRNEDWKDTPKSFRYRQSDTSDVEILKVDEVKEVGIFDEAKYISRYLRVDLSSHQLEKLSSEINPKYEYKSLFLKAVVMGDASLYVYRDSGIVRYFFSVKEANVQQLIYHPYKVEDRVSENNAFRQQLMSALSCQELSLLDFTTLKYQSRELIDIFIRYNQCSGSEIERYDENSKLSLRVKLRPGLRYSSFASSIPFSAFRREISEFGGKILPRFGIEFEIILPFRKDKFALSIEPTYQYYSGSYDEAIGFYSKMTVDYKSIEIPFTLKYFLYLNQDSKLFFTGSCYADINLNSYYRFLRTDGNAIRSPERLKATSSFGGGIGYEILEKYSVEVRYQLFRDLFAKSVSWKTEYDNLSLIFGYRLF